jgi:DNA-binding CsgD family transcriptional regulator
MRVSKRAPTPAARGIASTEPAALLPLVESLYAATYDRDGWAPFLRRYGDAVRGTTTGLLAQDVRHDRGAVDVFVGFDPTWLRRYREYYSRLNPWIMQRKDLLQPGAVATSQMICPDSDVFRTEYYGEFLRPQGIFHGLRGVILREDSRVYALTTLRPSVKGPFGQPELQVLRALMPHLQTALQIQRRMAGLQEVRDAASAAFDYMAFGAILLDSSGQPLVINRSAKQVLDERDGLTVGCNGLHAATAMETAHLRRLISDATATSAGHGLGAGGLLNVSRPSLRRPLAVLVAPLGRRDLGLASRRAFVAVFVSDPERNPESPPELLQRLYALTPAEGRLVRLLVQGNTLEAAAEELAISRHTARTHLKSVFSKTGARRQADLLRMVLTGPAALRHD